MYIILCTIGYHFVKSSWKYSVCEVACLIRDEIIIDVCITVGRAF